MFEGSILDESAWEDVKSIVEEVFIDELECLPCKEEVLQGRGNFLPEEGGTMKMDLGQIITCVSTGITVIQMIYGYYRNHHTETTDYVGTIIRTVDVFNGFNFSDAQKEQLIEKKDEINSALQNFFTKKK